MLLSDLELGQSSSSSGTVIGMDADLAGLSDIKLSVEQSPSDVHPGKPAESKASADDETTAFDSSDLQLGEEELPMGSSTDPGKEGGCRKAGRRKAGGRQTGGGQAHGPQERLRHRPGRRRLARAGRLR